MTKKRKAGKALNEQKSSKSLKYDVEETFDNSEDEFYAGRDKILLDDDHNTKKRQHVIEQERNLQPSDEEILAYDESEENETEEEEGEEEKEVDVSDVEEETDDENWGDNRAAYYNADVIETQADAIEEEVEAKRLQQKQIKGMTEADFGFDDTAWAETQTSIPGKRSVIEKLPEVEISKDATENEKVLILRNRYPEFEPLARDFVDLQHTRYDLNQKVAETQNLLRAGARMGSGIPPQTKLHALSTYLGTIAIYFAVLSSTIQANPDPDRVTSIHPAELREHAVIENLAKSRQLWDRVKDQKMGKIEFVKKYDPSLQGETRQVQQNTTPTEKPKSQASGRKARELLGTEKDSITKRESTMKRSKRIKHTDLQSLLATSALPVEDDSEFGDEDPLTQEQAAEKAKKRKSLRFYTSQIAQKANKRGTASREAGGDDDLPYKERNRDRQERLLREAEARGKIQANQHEELGGTDDEEVENGAANDYYRSLVTRSDQKKTEKKAKANAYAAATKQGAQVYEEEVVGEDGKRAITYAIQKNKGLTPKRKKDVRNPRVKKRKKFDEKLKKLGSIRQVYKGGEGRGGYGGELTGIKTNLVRGIKL